MQYSFTVCPTGGYYTKIENRNMCLLLGENEMTWQEAVDFCQTFSGSMFTPQSEEESTDALGYFQLMRNMRGKSRFMFVGKIAIFNY